MDEKCWQVQIGALCPFVIIFRTEGTEYTEIFYQLSMEIPISSPSIHSTLMWFKSPSGDVLSGVEVGEPIRAKGQKELRTRDFSFEDFYGRAGQGHHFKLLWACALKINFQVAA